MPEYYLVVLHWDSSPGDTASGSSMLCATSSLLDSGPGHLSMAIIQHGTLEAPAPDGSIEEALRNAVDENALGILNYGGRQTFLAKNQRDCNADNSIAQAFYMSFFSAESICGGRGRVFKILSTDVDDMGRPPSDFKYQPITEVTYNSIKASICEMYDDPGNWAFGRNCSTLVRELVELSIDPTSGRPRDHIIRSQSLCERLTTCIDTPNGVFERIRGSVVECNGPGNRVAPTTHSLRARGIET